MNLCYLAKFGKNKFNLWHMLLGAIAGGAHTAIRDWDEVLRFYFVFEGEGPSIGVKTFCPSPSDQPLLPVRHSAHRYGM